MAGYNYGKEFKKKLSQLSEEIETGDILFFDNFGLPSYIIRSFSGDLISHVGLASKNQKSGVSVFQAMHYTVFRIPERVFGAVDQVPLGEACRKTNVLYVKRPILPTGFDTGEMMNNLENMKSPRGKFDTINMIRYVANKMMGPCSSNFTYPQRDGKQYCVSLIERLYRESGIITAHEGFSPELEFLTPGQYMMSEKLNDAFMVDFRD